MATIKFSKDLFLGFWLLFIGFFISDNYLFSFLSLDSFELRMWGAVAIFGTATACFIHAVLNSKLVEKGQ